MTDTSPTTAPGTPQDADWLTTPIEFEEERGFRTARRHMRVIVGVVAAALVWAGVMPIRELSLARGQLVPLSQVRPVQHLEGGIVDAILVKEGDIVEEHQPLMRINPVQATSELATLRARANNLVLVKERMEALVAGRDADFGKVPTALAREHLEVYQRRLAHREEEQRVLRARIDQRLTDVASLEAEVVTGHKLLDIQEQQLAMRRKLVSMGAASKKQVLDVETALEQARSQLQSSQGKLESTRKSLAEARAALAASDAEGRKLWSEELVKTSADLAEVEETIKKHTDRVERLIVRAPARGRVQQVLQRSVGEVVRAGETVARIVPVDDALLAEVRLKPDDIAAIKPGDKAELKVTAYDFNKFGKIEGQVADISPTTFEDENKHHYYRVLIRYDEHRAPGARPWRLQPGMVVDAEIVSGQKSLLRYLMKPISRGVDIAFSER